MSTFQRVFKNTAAKVSLFLVKWSDYMHNVKSFMPGRNLLTLRDRILINHNQSPSLRTRQKGLIYKHAPVLSAIDRRLPRYSSSVRRWASELMTCLKFGGKANVAWHLSSAKSLTAANSNLHVARLH